MALDNIVVLVTGAGGGLGTAMTCGLLQAGHRVVGLDLAAARESLVALEREAALLGAGERFHGVVADIRSEADCDRAVAAARERFGGLHALVNNAGLGMSAHSLGAQDGKLRFYEMPADFWRAVFDTNVNGSFNMARAVAPHLVEQGWGRIVNVVTGLATMVRGGFTPYGPAKAALEAATAAWAEELAGTGVTVNALLPGGAADTPMVPRASVGDRSTLIAPRTMVAPVVWLTSPAADSVNGLRIIGRDWDPDVAADANLARSERAGWKR
jgi:NAD(P)-dependent dehydrogenase (short-subunit alcohol dehydrogenase family)